MEKIVVLGTGNATVKNCYNTCFALKKEDGYFLVDAGGGNGILKQLDTMNIPLNHIHHLFVSHAHTDHILGVVWLVRMIATQMLSGKYEGEFHIYTFKELIETIQTLCKLTLQQKLISCFDKTIIFHEVNDGAQMNILNTTFTFFDIHSTKAKQFAFTFINNDKQKIAFVGDEPYNEECFKYVEKADWLLHEAFCLYDERDIFDPYKKHHSTVKDAAILAETLNVKHLVLWHTEEKNLSCRKELYTNEAKQYFNGMIYVPNDLEIIEL